MARRISQKSVVIDLPGPYYLTATEIIQAFSGTANALNLTIDGKETT